MNSPSRSIIHIDHSKCNGCGICVESCHEGAIRMENGKAVLVSDTYCDGLGDCLAPCPVGAISLITRPAKPYDANAAAKRISQTEKVPPLPCGCPGTMSMTRNTTAISATRDTTCGATASEGSELGSWPVKLALVSPNAPYLQGADILLVADCAPVAVPNFHASYLRGRVPLVFCPKFEDGGRQLDKLADIIATARPASVTILRMWVPCCAGLERIAAGAVEKSGVAVPIHSVIVAMDGTETPRQ